MRREAQRGESEVVGGCRAEIFVCVKRSKAIVDALLAWSMGVVLLAFEAVFLSPGLTWALCVSKILFRVSSLGSLT